MLRDGVWLRREIGFAERRWIGGLTRSFLFLLLVIVVIIIFLFIVIVVEGVAEDGSLRRRVARSLHGRRHVVGGFERREVAVVGAKAARRHLTVGEGLLVQASRPKLTRR